MTNITLRPSRPAAAFLSALDAVLDRVEGFFRSFFSDRPHDLQDAVHEAQIRHMTARGNSGQATL